MPTAAALPSTTTLLASTGMLWVVYRRIRRNFGLQRWRPTRMGIRFALLSVIGFVLCAAAVTSPQLGPALAASLACGLGLGIFGLSQTRIERVDGERCYTPNPWIGGILTSVLLARIAWRWTHGGLLAQAQQASPLTFAIAGLLIGYSLAYTGGLIWRMRQLPAETATPSLGAAETQR